MKIQHYRGLYALALTTCLIVGSLAHAETDEAVLEPAAFEKSVWDVSTALLTIDLIDALKAVRDTHDLIASKGAAPDIVVLFRSMSDKQVARAEQRGRMISPAIMEEAQGLFEALAALPGVKLQTDDRSSKLLREEYRPLISLIDDVYLALIAYQAQGYSLVPMYPLAGLR